MANYGGFNFTGFQGVNLKNTAAIRFGQSGSDLAGTLSVKSDDEGSRSWVLPAKSGSLPISGTFTIQLPAASAVYFSTAVTVSGIRVEDGITVTLSERTGATGYVFGTQGTAYVLERAQAANGSINLFFRNPGNATGYIELVGAYTAVR